MFRKDKYSLGFLLFWFIASQVLMAQQSTWSLEDCLEQGRNHSRELRGAQLKLAHQEISLQQIKRSKDPKLYANTQLGMQFGRNIDPTTNTFNNDGIFFHSAAIQGTFTLYQGGRQKFVQQQQQFNLLAAQEDAQQLEFQLKLDLTNAYLRILLADEKLGLLESSLSASLEQLDRISKDIEIGVRPERDRVNIEAQLAIERKKVTDASYQLEEAYRSLKFLIGLEVGFPIRIEKAIDEDWQEAQNLTLTDLNRDNALELFPAQQAAKARVRAVEAEQRRINADQLPKVELFGNIGTQFSSAAQKLNGLEEQIVEQQVWIEGEPTTLSVMQYAPNYTNDPYDQQLKNNFGQSLGLRATWSIWDGKTNSFARQQAAVSKLEAELLVQQQEEWLSHELDRSYRYLEASKSSYQLAEQSVKAAKEAYEMMQGSFTAGGASAYELLEAKQRLNNAETSLVEAKYDCLFAYKIVKTLY